MSLSSMYIYTCIIHPPGFLPLGWAGKNTRQILIETCGFVDQGVVICVWLPPLHVSTPKKCVAQSAVFLHLCLESLCVFLTLSLTPSLPVLSLSSSCLSLYLNILFSVYMCCLLCVFDSDKKGATVQVQGNSWYQSVGTPDIKVSLSLSLSLSHTHTHTHTHTHIFCLSLSLLCQCVCPLISKLLGSKNLTVSV